MTARQHDKHAGSSCLRWGRGGNAAVLRFAAHDTAIDLVLVGQVSATERANACLRLEAEAGSGWTAWCRCCDEKRYRGSARLTLVAVRVGATRKAAQQIESLSNDNNTSIISISTTYTHTYTHAPAQAPLRLLNSLTCSAKLTRRRIKRPVDQLLT